MSRLGPIVARLQEQVNYLDSDLEALRSTLAQLKELEEAEKIPPKVLKGAHLVVYHYNEDPSSGVKINVIKVIRALMGLGLKDAKALSEAKPFFNIEPQTFHTLTDLRHHPEVETLDRCGVTYRLVEEEKEPVSPQSPRW